MNYIDIILGLILAFSVYQGFTKGLIVMGGTLLALFVGVWGAVHFSGFVESLLVNKLNLHSNYNSLIAFALTFILIVIVVNLFAKLLKKLAEAIALGLIDKILGVVFAIAKNAFIVSVLLVVLNGIDRTVNFMPRQKMNQSLLYRPVARFAPSLFPFLDFDKIKQQFNSDSDSTKK